MKITLARALKIKKVLAGKIAENTRQFQMENSMVEGKERGDVCAMEQRMKDLSAFMVLLKTRITTANQGMISDLFTLPEKKTMLMVYKGLNTEHGDSGDVHYGTDKKIVHLAIVRREDKEKAVAQLEAEIEALQEKIDQYNYTTSIEVPDEMMKAIGLGR